MDRYTPRMLELGLKGIIGKGGRGPAVRDALKERTAVYMAALGGGGALAALQIRSQEVIAFVELGPEAIREMEVEDLPVWVVNDCQGRDFYTQAVAPWRRDDLLPEEFRLGAGG
jgi:fumarate hydratase subunit beta